MPEVKLQVEVTVNVPKDQEDPYAWATEYVRQALDAKNRVNIIVVRRENKVL